MKDKILKLLKSKLFLSLVVNLIIAAFCIEVTSFSFDCSEDFYNSLYICKYHNYYDNNINYILATLIGSVQYILTGFNCFVLTQIVLSFFAFTSFTYVMTDKFGKSKAIMFTVVINTLFALNHYADIQSTKTAALLLAAGFLLVLNAIRNKRYNSPCWIGIAEILLGSFFNFEYFFIALAFAVAFFFAEMIAKKKYKIKLRKFFWFFRPYLLLFVFITALVFCGNWYSYSVNNSSEELSNNYEFLELTDSIETLTYPDYKEHEEQFNEIGIYENEYELLKNGYYDPENSLNNTALSLVSQIQQQENTKTVLGEIAEMWSDIGSHLASFDCYALIIIILAIIIIIYLILQKTRYLFFPLFYLIIGLTANTAIRYFYTSADYLIYGIWLLMYMFIIFSIDFEQFRSTNKAPSFMVMKRAPIFISTVLSICLFITYCIVYQANITTVSLNDKPSNLYAEINRHPERYYVLDPLTAEEYLRYTDNYTHPLWGFRSSFLQNVDDFGYFKKTEQLINHNLPLNLYEAVLSDKNVYVIDNYITYRKENYLKEHYAQDGEFVVYSQSNEINKYKIYSVTTN